MTVTIRSGLSGVFSVIKPVGITSAQLCNRIRTDILKELGYPEAKQADLKIGHGGTLDKDASGVLPIGLGSGCKHLHNLLHSDKRYLCDAVIGVETNTGCSTGMETRRLPFDHVTADLVEDALKKFRGNIAQVPPRFSALKYKGRRLSDMAYAGETIPEEKLQPRPVVVYQLHYSHLQLPLIKLDIHCSSGFYVRSFVSDFGRELKTCAHVGCLERLQHGPFTLTDSIPAFAWTVDRIVAAIGLSRSHLDRLTTSSKAEKPKKRSATTRK